MDYTAIISRWCLSISLLLVSVSGQHISCTVSGNVQEEESASLTCDYRTDLEEHGVGFYIYRYPLGGGDPDVPAICDWEKDFLRCDVSSGYKVRVQGHRMILNISAAQQSHAGRYVCHVLQPEKELQSEQCDLVVNRKNNNFDKIDCHAVRDALSGHSTAIMCFVPQNVGAKNMSWERHSSSQTSIEVILRCDMKTDMCQTQYLGHQFTTLESPQHTGFKVMVALVNTAGKYTCRVERDVPGNPLICPLDVQIATKTETIMETPEGSHEEIMYALLGVTGTILFVIFILLGACIFILVLSKKRQKRGR